MSNPIGGAGRNFFQRFVHSVRAAFRGSRTTTIQNSNDIVRTNTPQRPRPQSPSHQRTPSNLLPRVHGYHRTGMQAGVPFPNPDGRTSSFGIAQAVEDAGIGHPDDSSQRGAVGGFVTVQKGILKHDANPSVPYKHTKITVSDGITRQRVGGVIKTSNDEALSDPDSEENTVSPDTKVKFKPCVDTFIRVGYEDEEVCDYMLIPNPNDPTSTKEVYAGTGQTIYGAPFIPPLDPIKTIEMQLNDFFQEVDYADMCLREYQKYIQCARTENNPEAKKIFLALALKATRNIQAAAEAAIKIDDSIRRSQLNNQQISLLAKGRIEVQAQATSAIRAELNVVGLLQRFEANQASPSSVARIPRVRFNQND